MTQAWLTVVGVGDDGLAGVSPTGSAALNGADLVIGHHPHVVRGVEVDDELVL